MANLLPEEKRFAMFNSYRLRLAIVALWLFFALAFGGIILLVPSFAAVLSGLSSAKTELNIIQAGGEGISKEMNQEIVAAREQIKLLTPEEEISLSASGRLERILNHLGQGIFLRTFVAAASGLVELRGEARTRDEFIKFIQALRGDRFIARVDSPVSNLISEEGANFVIKVSFVK